ncbi:MAG: NAD(P)/FAD-dependent oxidoreductase [Polaromonas sp.]|jgi:L-2-hydroxyglutarate oxidase LhgO|uniref:NAD(P)/FAD-dependent oxidoreductase n=1 Tax=Polaromonas sp. TaxID=1869339 RepID=UPI00272EF0D8|nr:NAD(P)/FAD-dependent oxidoreductase [Polaromonas sp.]MDP2255872.1 NAD(P)/FAD-dependent oxidoreductase [Polaromonas sp.]MDP3708448.1 NAD(P)/FAD-dependent oxidoreductase [Polaromonas sp.]
MDQIDCVVIGAGVVGLAVARALALQGREVMVLEAADAIGTGTSSRNSEVIHAGIYYGEGSLKAGLCVQGKDLLYAYCAERGIGFSRCGKLIVATSDAQVAQLHVMMAKAAANGVHDLVLLTREQARALEPQLECVAAVHSPSTGIVDSHALMLALQGDLENAGGLVVLNSALAHAEFAQDAIVLVAKDGTELQANAVVNAAGLQAQALARRFAGLAAEFVPPSHYAKGSYFTLAGRSPFARLIYPVPEAAGLGVHLTIDLGGQAKFGPDVQWVSSPDDLVVDPARGDAFYAEVRKYWPELQDGALIPGYAGIRPKIQGPGEPARDFLIQGPAVHGVAGLVNLFGMESPGLTSALAIGEHVRRLLP